MEQVLVANTTRRNNRIGYELLIHVNAAFLKAFIYPGNVGQSWRSPLALFLISLSQDAIKPRPL